MLSAAEFEYTIVGAGLSGLALANTLCKLEAKGATAKSICLIEPRLSYVRDHTWCFWNNVVEKLNVPLTKKWHKWKVRYRSKNSVRGSKQYPYTCVLADDYYDQALKPLKACDNVQLFLGESVESIAYSNSRIEISTAERTVYSQFLFDSRPPRMLEQEFKQDFFGWHVRSIKGVFDVDCLTLMDFTEVEIANSGRGFHFFYVLPFSDTDALVESVWVGFERLAKEEHERLLISYLSTEYGLDGLDAFAKIHVEHGCIPMHTVQGKSPDRRHALIGLAGGMARSSTGYAFAAIHHSNSAIGRAIERRRWPNIVEGLSSKAQLLDKVLLTYLKQNPSEGPLLLSSLFERVDADVLVRFLCDRSSLADDAAIFAVMPRKIELSAIMAKVIL
ncbi:MAG: lycopene cyclase family protein [Candidatus Melainabacteria bacterium]|nr:lycopene cyclase family protein [Candidatus Melainabacteria bacterium]